MGESVIDRFERRAEAFHKATGIFAPGVSIPPEMGQGGPTYDIRMEAWIKWQQENPEPVAEGVAE